MKTKTIFKWLEPLLFASVMFIMFLIFFKCVTKISDHIEKKGLKSIFNEVWEGKNEN